MLKFIQPDKYCLISNEKYDNAYNNDAATEKLPSQHYYLNDIYKSKIIRVAPWVGLFTIYSRAKAIEKIIQKENCGVLIACTADLYNLPSAFLACRQTSIKFVPYIFDDYAYQWSGINRLISKKLEPILLKNADAIIVTNEYMQKEYLKRYGVNSTVIHNPCSLPDIDELDKADRVLNESEINIIYTGSIYSAHYDAFRNLIAAIQHLKRSDVKLHLYTSQTESDLIQKGISGKMVVYHRHISQSEIPKVLRQASILFLPLAFDSPIPEVIKTSAPGKTGEYLSIGKTILVHAPHDSFISWYFRENKCGIVVNENDPLFLSESIKKIISNPQLQIEFGKNARIQAEKDFDIKIMNSKFVEIINNITDSM